MAVPDGKFAIKGGYVGQGTAGRRDGVGASGPVTQCGPEQPKRADTGYPNALQHN
jgi:hypothetical protein